MSTTDTEGLAERFAEIMNLTGFAANEKGLDYAQFCAANEQAILTAFRSPWRGEAEKALREARKFIGDHGYYEDGCDCAICGATIELLATLDDTLAVLASPGDDGWRDIASAPKDGTSVLIGCDWEPLAVVGYWGANGNTPLTEHDKGQPEWRVKWDDTIINGGFEATHWCPLHPLPPPPGDDGGQR